MFFQKTASVLAPKLICLFRRLLHGGEFPLEWRIADVTPILKGPLSALVCNYRPISITPVLSKVFERLIALRFGRFWRDLGSCLLTDLWHRRKVESLSVFCKIDSLVDHPVYGLFPAQYVMRRPTRGALAAHSRSFEMPRSRTVQFSRSFVLSCVRLWNGLHESVFAGEGLGAFKTSVNRFLLQGWLPAVSSFSSTVSLSFFLFSGPKIAWGSSDL